MIFRCGLTSCPHFSSPCESSDFNFKCPIGEIDENGFDEIADANEEFFCLVVGSRTFKNYSLFTNKMDIALSKHLKKRIVIVSGGADGTDKMAEKYAVDKGYKLYIIKADWSTGQSAGYKRNEEMHRFIALHQNRGCIAFWDGKSKGTQHSFALAPKYKNQLKVIRI